MSDEEVAETALFPDRVGDRLRAARVKAGLDINDIATRTRVPLRHLMAIESGDYSSLPSPTYSVGFVKSFARAVGLDEASAAASLRDELGHRTVHERLDMPDYVEEDSGPLAPRWLAWTAAAIALVGVLGYGAVWGHWFGGGRTADDAIVAPPDEQAPPAEAPAATAQPAQPAAAPQGQVVLTAKSEVWLRVYDANNTTLFMNTLAAGQRFEVPATANKPMIKTGRADQITVTVGGQEVAPLGPPERTIRDVELTAASLNARPAPVAPPSAMGSIAPPAPAGVPTPAGAPGTQNGAAPAIQP